MLISIITPTYNSAATLPHTLQSIGEQKGVDVEHIIIDGASQDGTVGLIRANRSSIAHFVSEPDEGLYDAMNKGLRLASGDIVGILNSDDFYTHEGVLAKVKQAFQKQKTDTLYGDLQYVDALHTDKVIRHWQSGPYRHRNFLFGWMPPHPTFFVRRKLYQKHGLFDTSFRSAADYELMLRFLYKHHASAYYLPEVLVKMRVGGLSNASFRHRLHANKEDRRAWHKNGLKPRFYTTFLKPLRKVGQFRGEGFGF